MYFVMVLRIHNKYKLMNDTYYKCTYSYSQFITLFILCTLLFFKFMVEIRVHVVFVIGLPIFTAAAIFTITTETN